MDKKKKFSLTIICTLLVVVLFYNQSVAFNFSLISLITWGILNFNTKQKRKDKSYWLLTFILFLTALSQFIYSDIYSFIALFFALSAYGLYAQFGKLNFILYPVVRFINSVVFLFRILSGEWIPKRKKGSKILSKLFAWFVMPVLFSIIFLLIYSTGSELIADFFKNIKFDFDVKHLSTLIIIGIFFFFNFWSPYIPRFLIKFNQSLSNDFREHQKEKLKPTYNFLELDLERKSGEITLVMLNIFLLIFILSYNYEQFFMSSSDGNLSAETHERVTTIVFSIIMAIGVILFYFKSTFNFDAKAKGLKKLTILWIVLNFLLVLSAITKNTEYILQFGLTFKRIGVYIFLTLSIIGLLFSYLKIKNKKTNLYLINRMTWTFFIAFTSCSIINFSWIVTSYNLSTNKGVESYYLRSFNYNKQVLYDTYKNDPEWMDFFDNERYKQEKTLEKSFLSHNLYDHYIDFGD
jgi:MFS family permease